MVDPESQVREVLLKDKFLTQSAPDICKKTQSVAERKKVIEPSNTDMYSCICMSGTLLTGEKKIRDTMASLLLSEKAPTNWGLHPELATMVDRRGTSAEKAQKGDRQGVSPAPNLPSLQG
jgi:hypothetical protein